MRKRSSPHSYSKMDANTCDPEAMMDTGQASESEITDDSQSTTSIKLDMFHPLTSITPEFQQCRDQPDLPYKPTQSVLVNDALYISHPDKAMIYKYSISKKSWYTLPTGVSKYILATYHSKVVLVGVRNDDGAEQYIRVPDDTDLEKRLNSSNTSQLKNVCAAVSDDSCLFVICSNGLWVFNGTDWIQSSMKENSNSNAMQKEISENVCHALIHDGFIYMCIDSTSKLYRVALSAVNFTKSPTNFVWEVMKTEHQKSPNLTKVGNQIIKVITKGPGLEISAYSVLNQKWVEIEDLKLAAFRSIKIVSAVGVPVSEQHPKQLELWIVGKFEQIGVMEKVATLKVVIKMKQYQPCDLVTLRQLYKLEMGAQQIDVLTQLIPHIEAFKDMAGFMLNESNALYHYRYECDHPMAAYICSWQFEESPMREPTWKNFLYILREIDLKSLATKIECFLQASNHLAVAEETNMQTVAPKTTTLIADLKEGLSNLCNQLTDEHRQQVSTFTEHCEMILQSVAKEKQEHLDKKEELERKIIEQDNQLQWHITWFRHLHQGSSAKRPRTEPEVNKPEVEELKPELNDVLRELFTYAANWENLGIFLGVNAGQLEAIKSSNNQSENCLREMLKLWLQQVDPAPTWKAMVNAIQYLHDFDFASKLEKKYCIAP